MGTNTDQQVLASTDSGTAVGRAEGTEAAARSHTAEDTVAIPAQNFRTKGRGAAEPFTHRCWPGTLGCKRGSLLVAVSLAQEFPPLHT